MPSPRTRTWTCRTASSHRPSTSGTNGAITFEFWATVATQRTWQRFGDFGTSNGGENMSPGGATSQYILITPNSGRVRRNDNGLEMTNHPASNLAEPNVGCAGPFPVGTEQHVVAVYDHTNTSGGTNPNGTMALYLQRCPDRHKCDSPRHQLADGQRQQQLAGPLAVA